MRWLSRTGKRKPGFTLVELLVVVLVLIMLVALLLPALQASMDKANEVICVNNLRQLMHAFMLFAIDHQGQLPGNVYDRGNADPDKRDWLYGDASAGFSATPQSGTLWPYVSSTVNSSGSSATSLYRCPSLSFFGVGSGKGTNGKFDYSVFLSFTGARISQISPQSRFTDAAGVITTVPTPIIVEENAAQWINVCCIEGGHANTDQLAHTHRGGCFYATVSGGVSWFKEPAYASTWNWTTQTPSGAWARTGTDVAWGWWLTQ